MRLGEAADVQRLAGQVATEADQRATRPPPRPSRPRRPRVEVVPATSRELGGPLGRQRTRRSGSGPAAAGRTRARRPRRAATRDGDERAVVVHLDGTTSAPDRFEQVEQRREAGMLDGHPVAEADEASRMARSRASIAPSTIVKRLGRERPVGAQDSRAARGRPARRDRSRSAAFACRRAGPGQVGQQRGSGTPVDRSSSNGRGAIERPPVARRARPACARRRPSRAGRRCGWRPSARSSAQAALTVVGRQLRSSATARIGGSCVPGGERRRRPIARPTALARPRAVGSSGRAAQTDVDHVL